MQAVHEKTMRDTTREMSISKDNLLFSKSKGFQI